MLKEKASPDFIMVGYNITDWCH
ncbi:protein of unknown function [Kyrpidia spormannii]|uniref:Uncharacterized protein n=2 Tax=Kyrpidia spormannii TaxID=2055160 RepID=A0ACA8Z4Z6_9BACL|nr:protein of unknown function [Kyrpidia spormannii]CAB3390420.1 protein of unknown function [Kyrpidia spormannii]